VVPSIAQLEERKTVIGYIAQNHLDVAGSIPARRIFLVPATLLVHSCQANQLLKCPKSHFYRTDTLKFTKSVINMLINCVKIIIFTSPNDAQVTHGEAIITGHLPARLSGDCTQGSSNSLSSDIHSLASYSF
jgi:hypothetical protein